MNKCPECNAEIEDLVEKAWVTEAEFDTLFDTKCPVCGKTIEVEVQQVPIFIIRKSEQKK